MDTKVIYYDIIGGPSKDLLFDACKYAYNKSAKITVDFTVVIGYSSTKDDPKCAYLPMSITDVKVNALEHEDASGDKFMVRGFCKADLTIHNGDADYKPYKFRSYYDTKSRIGCITFVEIQ